MTIDAKGYTKMKDSAINAETISSIVDRVKPGLMYWIQFESVNRFDSLKSEVMQIDGAILQPMLKDQLQLDTSKMKIIMEIGDDGNEYDENGEDDEED